MTFKPSIWQPIAIALSALNIAGAGFAARAAEPWHATVHVGLAVLLAVWAQRLGQRRSALGGEARLQDLELEMNNLRQELSEAQERLDFAERMLAQGQGQATRRVGPEH